MKKIDIVYPLGTGSGWNNAEIRYSLRAIERNLKGYGNIIIVGQCPDFIDKSKVIYIPCDDPLHSNADGNIALKVLKACNDKRVSDDFLFINDDHIINKPLEASQMGFYHKGNFADYADSFWHDGLHRRRLRRTFEVLREKGCSTFHFDLHVPILINKEQFVKTVPNFNFQDDIGYTMKSIYANPVVPDNKKEFIGSLKRKIFRHKTLDEIQEIFKMAHFISYNDQGLNGALKYFLALYLPEISKYELYDKEQEPAVAIRDYLERASQGMTPQLWDEGIKLFMKYGKNSNLLSMFQRKRNQHTEEKLLYKLERKADII